MIWIDFRVICLFFNKDFFHAVEKGWILNALLHETLKMLVFNLLEAGHKLIYINKMLLLSSKDILLLFEYISDAEEFKLYNIK